MRLDWKRRPWASACVLAVGAAFSLTLIASSSTGPLAAERDEDGPTREELLREVERLREAVERLDGRSEEVERLRERIERLEAELRRAEAEREDDELRDLLEEAEAQAAEEAEKEEEAEAQREIFVGRQRTQQALNPEISFLGDFSYGWTDNEVRDEFLIRAVEISFQAPLDPYTRFKGFLSGHQEAAELHHEEEGVAPAEEGGHAHESEIAANIEEAYMEWVALPLGTKLRVGKFRQQFGTLNRWHEHALPSPDVPFALRNIFSDEGLNGVGVGADWQLPGLWATSHAVTVEITNADNGRAFAGGEFRDPAYLLRHTGFFDFGPNSYLDIGLNAVTGPNDEAGRLDTTVTSIDFNFNWEPVQRARYRGVEVRGEVIRTRFETEDIGTVDSTSLYTYVSWRLGRRWIVGLRYDDAELPSPRSELLEGLTFREGLRETAWSPYVTFWQSEFVRLRFQYQHAERDFVGPQGPDDDDRMWLQVTWAAGPHKHESY